MNAAAIILAAQMTRNESRSALPDAPVVPEREPRRSEKVRTVRFVTARALRRAAERVEPAQQRCA